MVRLAQSSVTEAASLENQFSFDLSELRDNPFRQAADTSYPYLSSSFREALAALYYGLEYGSRILMLTAAQGMGKTTMLRHFERRIHDRGRSLFLSLSHDKGVEVLHKLLAEIGGTVTIDDLPMMRVQADEILIRLVKVENPFILLLDYDENAAEFALESLNHLTSLESFDKGLLRVVIAGSPDVAEKLQGSAFADKVRRVPLAPLPAAEVESYIDYRLRLAGWKSGGPFTAKACTLIAERSSGKPSAINEICFDILQNPTELESERSDSPPGNKDSVLDEYDVDSAPRGPLPTVPMPAHSLKRRTAALTCIVIVLILAIAGFWYRNEIKAHAARHVTAEIAVPVAAALHSGVPYDWRSTQLPNPAHAVTGAGATGKGVSGTTTEAASEPVRNRETVSQVATPPVSAASSSAPVKAVSNTVAVRLTGAAPPILSSSPAAAVLKNDGDEPAKAIAKDDRVITPPLPRIVAPGQTPASSPVQQQTTAAHVAAVRGVAAAAEGNGATHTADEMAAYEIRLGDAYMNVGDYDKALASFSRAITFAPDNKAAEEKIKRARRAKAAEEGILQ